jgi:hypothetical protein
MLSGVIFNATIFLMSVNCCSGSLCISVVEGTRLSAQNGSGYTNYCYSFLRSASLSGAVRNNILGLCSCRIPHVWASILLVFNVEPVRPISHPDFAVF